MRRGEMTRRAVDQGTPGVRAKDAAEDADQRRFAGTLRIGAGREQEIARKAARAGVVARRLGAIERERIPTALRVEPPTEMRDGVAVHVVGMRLVAVEPVAHQLGIETALDLADE